MAARAAPDGALLEALKASGKWMKAIDLRAIAGGTPLQARKALARLCDDGRAQWKGKARGTQYGVST